MKREIKFRGISKKTCKWIHGYYLKNRGVDFIAPDEFAGDKTWEDYEVIPETVGQFTGLLDKNGKEIWEHDIVDWDGVKLLVEFIDGSFCIRENYEGATFHDLFFERDEINVIGNIYDKDFGYVIKNTKTNNIG